MNVRRHAQRRHARRRQPGPTLRQLLDSLEAYARARDQAGAEEDALYGHLRAHADRFAAELTCDLRRAGAAYVHVSWDLANDVPTYARIDPAELTPSAWPPIELTLHGDGIALDRWWVDEAPDA